MKQVQLNLTMKTFVYNTTNANYKCSLGNNLCSLKLFLLQFNAAVLTSPGPQQVKDCHLLISILISMRVIIALSLIVLEVLNGLSTISAFP